MVGSKKLSAWIERRGITQREAAKELGLDSTLLNHYLTGRRRPPLESAINIERGTGIPVEDWVATETDATSDTSRTTRVGRV